MRSIQPGLFLVLSLSIFPIQAQSRSQAPATIVFSIAGDDRWSSSINGVAVGWALTRPLRNASISARLANGGGYAGGFAYLTRAIGPGTEDLRAVAITPFELPTGFNGRFVLFTGLNLSEGEYWLVLRTPRRGPFSYANWITSTPLTVSILDHARYLGTTSVSSQGMADYAPASAFGDIWVGHGYQMEVTGFPDRDP